MKQLFLTPGPSQIYPTVANDIQNALEENIFSISHRSEKFQTIFYAATESLQKLLTIPQGYSIVFLASGTEAMERIIENIVGKNSFHFVAGSFGKRWYEIAKELGKNPQKYEVPFGQGFEKIPEISKYTELICFTQNETSSGTAVDPQFIYTVGRKNPQALLAVDTVSSSPYIELDYSKLDCIFFSVQKLFGLPAGLGALILSPKALEKAKNLQQKGITIGTYHNFPTLIEWAVKKQTPETPNVLGLYLLGKVAEDMIRKGIKKIREDQEEKAALLYDFFDKHSEYNPFVGNRKNRSQTVIVVNTGSRTKSIKKKLKEKGFVVGSGYGAYKDIQIRIANFPAVEIQEMKKFLEVFTYVA